MGTPVQTATDEQLSLMWTEVVNLLKIQFSDQDEEDLFFEDLQDLNDWLRRQYGPRRVTCEEVRLAYNSLVMEDLQKSDGRTLEAYPRLDARHVGEVLAAYRRFTDNDVEVNRVLANGLYLPKPQEPAQHEIDEFMNAALEHAINEVANGRYFYDTGNGLYTWLYNQEKLRPTQDEWSAALTEAQSRVRTSLADQQQAAATREGPTHLRSAIQKRLADVLNETGPFVAMVRQEAYRILLMNYLFERAGNVVAFNKPKRLPTTPPLPITKPVEEPSKVPPFHHGQYLESLKEQLPEMGDEQVSNLQSSARRRNLLDVYELATTEWQKRHPTV